MANIRNRGLPSCDHPCRSTYVNGCRCDECVRINAAALKQYRIRRYQGTNDVLVDSGPAQEKLRRLKALGYTERELMAFGVHSPWRIMRTQKIHKSTEDIILGISGRRLYDGEAVDSGAARYLITRWHDKGINDSELARTIGVSRRTVGDIRRGKLERIRIATLGKIMRSKAAIDEMAIERGLV